MSRRAWLAPADRMRVTQAVRTAEAATDAEIMTVVAPWSDRYHDVVLHAAILAMLATIAVAAAHPALLDGIVALARGGWAAGDDTGDAGLRLRALLLLVAAMFLLVRAVAGLAAPRRLLTPGATAARRVRRRAIALFRTGVEAHTAGHNGVLLYLSLAERRAEIVADAAVHAAVPAAHWGDILSALIGEVRAGRTGDGMVAAVAAIGATLATHFPHSGHDAPELPDRVILL